MKENELYVVKEFEFDNPVITKTDSIINSCYRGCHNNNFHTFEFACIFDIKLTNIKINEIFDITKSDESMGLFEINKKLTVARQKCFKFNQKKTNNKKL